MAGPYDLSGVTTDDFLDAPESQPLLFPLPAGRLPGRVSSGAEPGQPAAPRRTTTLPPLLTATPAAPKSTPPCPRTRSKSCRRISWPHFIRTWRHPFRLALQENECLPLEAGRAHAAIPVLRRYGRRTPPSSQIALASFRPSATPGPILRPPSRATTTCAQPSLLLAKTWFDSLRQPPRRRPGRDRSGAMLGSADIGFSGANYRRSLTGCSPGQ